jgi:carbon storage regulator
MLVLSRHEHEQIKLGEAIVVTVVRISGDRVRLGIEAPESVNILRAELPPLPQVETSADSSST